MKVFDRICLGQEKVTIELNCKANNEVKMSH